ncbi:MAG: hypothetical protein MUP16_04915 [Sedimentisphaerales bacterium]|nr:hypothetical protein [Sedimentisphaerales bacterium]
MAQIREIETINFNADRDPELLKKLNTLAPRMNRKVHDLARFILTKFCNEELQKENSSSEVQSARAG